jgi:hydroxymethylbilane synthase
MIRIGTRGSALALWQANEVKRLLGHAGYESEIVKVRTTGDKRQNVSLASIGGKGLFIKELEEALTRREIDIAVHSLKDVPSFIPKEFQLAAFLERADPRDAWVQPDGKAIGSMPDGATIGTSAPRRRAQLRALYPHFRIEDMRGNVDTRIQKVRSGQYDGAVLAGAGLKRLGRASEITSFFPIEQMTPAAGQGIVAIETMTDEARKAAEAIDHAPTAEAARCERAVLQMFEDRLDCYSAVGVHAEIGPTTTIHAFFGEIDGERLIRVQKSGADREELVRAVHGALIAGGAGEFAVRRSPIADGARK